MSLMNQLIIAPILLPLVTAALMLLLGEKRRPLKGRLNLLSTLIGLGIAITLLTWVRGQGQAESIGVYLPGNWPAPFGIVLVVDHLSALLLTLTGIIGVSALLFARARWDGAGASFHALFQIQLMGLYGAFLTADLFNLFVFFEVLLAASYGLLLHGSGRARVKAGLHYIAINLFASSLFTVGAAMLYGVTGTLNMADLALKIPLVPEADRGLLHAGAAILAMAFGQGRYLAAEFLAGAGLCLGQCTGRGTVRHHDQGWPVCGAAPVDPAVLQPGRRFGALRRPMAGLWRPGHFGGGGTVHPRRPAPERLAGLSIWSPPAPSWGHRFRPTDPHRQCIVLR